MGAACPAIDFARCPALVFASRGPPVNPPLLAEPPSSRFPSFCLGFASCRDDHAFSPTLPRSHQLLTVPRQDRRRRHGRYSYVMLHDFEVSSVALFCRHAIRAVMMTVRTLCGACSLALRRLADPP